MTIQFQNPQILWALFLLLLPVLIHFFNFKRYKKIYFSNIQFLKNLNTENKQKSRIKRWVILLLRLLAISSLVFVFAQPYFPDNNKKNLTSSKEIVNIYIDNSFSMNAETETGNALEVAKNSSYQLIKQLDDKAKIRIFDNQTQNIENYLNKEQAIAKIHSISTQGNRKNIVSILKQKNSSNKLFQRFYFFSDFQKNQFDVKNIQIDSNQMVTFLPLEIRSKNNLIADSCWFESDIHKIKQKEIIFIRIKNTSNQTFNKVPIKLLINDTIKAVDHFNISARKTKVVKLQYTNSQKGIYLGKIEIEDQPIVYDNNIYFSYQIKNKNHVLIVNQKDENKYLNRLYQNNENYSAKNILKTKLFNEKVNNYSLLVLHQIDKIESGLKKVLLNYLKASGTILFIPSNSMDTSINLFLSKISASNYLTVDTIANRIHRIELNSSIYENVFKKIDKNTRLPDVFKHYKIKSANNNLNENLWFATNNDVLFSKTTYKEGSFYQLNFQLNSDWTNLITHPIFVPSFLNIINQHNYSNHYQILNLKNTIRVQNDDKNNSNSQYHIKNSSIDIIPQAINHFDQGTLLYPKNQLNDAENYLVSLNDSIISPCSFNYSRLESSPIFYSERELKAICNKYGLDIQVNNPNQSDFQNHNKQLPENKFWKLFLVICIIAICSEGILSKVS